MTKRKIIITLIAISILGAIYYYFNYRNESIETLNINEENNIENKANEDTIEQEEIMVHVSGEVKEQGVYKLKIGSRVADAIEKAGGITKDANIDKINLAYILEDGMKIYIPNKNENLNETKDETNKYVSKNTDETIIKNENKKTAEKININTATETELENLPGIGASIAARICEYRKENGKFSKIEDIKKVKGIGENKYKQIKDLIKI